MGSCLDHAWLSQELSIFIILSQENAPVMHLRNPNQYVQAALGEWASKHGRVPLVPRTSGQQAFAPDNAAGERAVSDPYAPDECQLQ